MPFSSLTFHWCLRFSYFSLLILRWILLRWCHFLHFIDALSLFHYADADISFFDELMRSDIISILRHYFLSFIDYAFRHFFRYCYYFQTFHWCFAITFRFHIYAIDCLRLSIDADYGHALILWLLFITIFAIITLTLYHFEPLRHYDSYLRHTHYDIITPLRLLRWILRFHYHYVIIVYAIITTLSTLRFVIFFSLLPLSYFAACHYFRHY